MAEDTARPMTPQEMLKKANRDLASALRGALTSLENPAGTPRLVGIAIQALASAQQAWNAAVSSVPLRAMTDEVPPSETRPNANDDDRPFEIGTLNIPRLLKSTNPRKWADAFLAFNKNHAIDREILTEWFAAAIHGRQFTE
jgi:hypothetical protein